MSWAELIAAVFKLAILVFTTWREKSAARKAIKKTAMKEIKDGIAERDPTKITAAFDTINRYK